METALQITGYWFNIVTACVTIYLAYRTFILTKNDKQKAIAIDELKKQTKELENLYVYQIQPRFVAVAEFSLINIYNKGGDCYKINITTDESLLGVHGSAFVNCNNFCSALSLFRNIDYRERMNEVYIIRFEDRLGNKFEQEFKVGSFTISNVRNINV